VAEEIAEKFDYEDYNSQWWTEMFLDRFIDAIVQALHHIPEPEQTDPSSDSKNEWTKSTLGEFHRNQGL